VIAADPSLGRRWFPLSRFLFHPTRSLRRSAQYFFLMGSLPQMWARLQDDAQRLALTFKFICSFCPRMHRSCATGRRLFGAGRLFGLSCRRKLKVFFFDNRRGTLRDPSLIPSPLTSRVWPRLFSSFSSLSFYADVARFFLFYLRRLSRACSVCTVPPFLGLSPSMFYGREPPLPRTYVLPPDSVDPAQPFSPSFSFRRRWCGTFPPS